MIKQPLPVWLEKAQHAEASAPIVLVNGYTIEGETLYAAMEAMIIALGHARDEKGLLLGLASCVDNVPLARKHMRAFFEEAANR